MKKESLKQFKKRILGAGLGPQVKVGDRFQECDNRFVRIVEVIEVKKDRVKIQTLEPQTHRGIWSGRITWARLDRFHKNSHGYRPLYGKCYACQLKEGAVEPKGGLRGITVTSGICSVCLVPNSTLIPSSDFHWPKLGKKAVFD